MERLFREREAAAWLNLTPATLRRWRSEGVGPVYVRVGAAIRYAPADLAAYLQAGRTVPGEHPGARCVHAAPPRAGGTGKPRARPPKLRKAAP